MDDIEVKPSKNYKPTTIKRSADVIRKVFELTGSRGFICGGFARYAVSELNSPIVPNDIDVFCGDEANYDAINERFMENPDVHRKSKTRIETKYEYVVSGKGYDKRVLTIQLIRPSMIMNMVSDGDYERVLDNFDFTIAKCVITPNGAFAHKDFHTHDNSKMLVIENIHCPISSMKRVLKYHKRGFTIDSAELLKLFIDYEGRSLQWKELVAEGLKENSNLQGEELQAFIEAMYFD